MLQVSSGNKTINVRWKHIDKKETQCEVEILLGTFVDETVKTSAKVHVDDRFVKATGRKIALERALSKSTLTKADRTAVWNAYRNKCKL